MRTTSQWNGQGTRAYAMVAQWFYSGPTFVRREKKNAKKKILSQFVDDIFRAFCGASPLKHSKLHINVQCTTVKTQRQRTAISESARCVDGCCHRATMTTHLGVGNE